MKHRGDVAAEDADRGTHHADVGLHRGSAWQNTGVGGRHMGVGTEHRSHFAVQEIAHGELFTGRFGMEVDDDVFDRGGDLLQDLFDCFEGAVGRFAHERPAAR